MTTKKAATRTAEATVMARLKFRVRPTGSFLDFPKNKKPAYCLERVDGVYLGDARPEVARLWKLAVDLQASRIGSR
jgi:hypothetical protein